MAADARKSHRGEVPSGIYRAVLQGANNGTGVALFTLRAPCESRVANISVRRHVATGDGVMIGGFTVGGAQLAKVILCGIGPSLTSVGVAGAANSTGVALLELYDFRAVGKPVGVGACEMKSAWRLNELILQSAVWD